MISGPNDQERAASVDVEPHSSTPSEDMFAGYAPVTVEQAIESAHALIHHYFHTHAYPVFTHER